MDTRVSLENINSSLISPLKTAKILSKNTTDDSEQIGASTSTYSPIRTNQSSIQLDIDTAVSESQPLFDSNDNESLLSASEDVDSAQEDDDTKQMTSDPSSKRKKQPKVSSNGHSNGDANGHSNGHTNGHTVNNGHATGAESPSMLEQRRKGARPPESREAVAQNLMSRSSFSLDDPVPGTMGFEDADGHSVSTGSRGFTQLPEKDKRNFLLLVLLYFIQGLPMGLAMGSVPLLLKKHVSYTQMGVFSLASYPYSLKLLWSPIVDAMWSPKLGRRKSWILPIQTISGIGMLWLAGMVEDMINDAGGNGGQNVWGFTVWWFTLVFLCATQDIAVDGWALTLLSPENLSYASTAQTVGLTLGQFLTSTVFLAFNSKDFANRWFRAEPLEVGLVSLGGALSFCGWMYLIVTVGLAALKREEQTRNEDGVWDTYKVMLAILRKENVLSLMFVHLIAKIGFQANDGATALKLIDKGFGQDNLALAVLIDFPFEIALGYYVGKWSSVIPPMKLWSWAFGARLVAAGIAQFIVWIFPAEGVTTWYLVLVILTHIYSTFTNTVMFVAVAAFHAKIADPVYGGTYMTLLATLSNLGGTFPKFFVLKLIDMLSVATCNPSATPAVDAKGTPVTEAFSCVAENEKARCIAGGGTCNVSIDGYYIVNVLCIIIGVLTFWGYIKATVYRLQALPTRAWRLGHGIQS